jgi:hypothetical protein
MSLAMSRTGVSTLQLAGLEVMTLLTVGMALSSGRIGEGNMRDRAPWRRDAGVNAT